MCGLVDLWMCGCVMCDAWMRGRVAVGMWACGCVMFSGCEGVRMCDV